VNYQREKGIPNKVGEFKKLRKIIEDCHGIEECTGKVISIVESISRNL
jgi:hypothetical protein